MGIDSTGYDIIKVLHIACAIIGFGGVLLNGVYAAKASKRTPAEALAVTEVNFSVSNIAEYFIYATILLGFGVVGMSDKVWSFSQTWVWLSLVLAIIGVGISHGLLKPRVRAYIETQRTVAAAGTPTSEQTATLKQQANAIAPVSMVLDLLLVGILLMMVFKWGR
jgi:uncharacterized membrane protein